MMVSNFYLILSKIHISIKQRVFRAFLEFGTLTNVIGTVVANCTCFKGLA